MLTLDGSTLEGGGQLVRVALSISAICSIPVRITNIRAGRGAQAVFKPDRKSREGGGGRRKDGHENKKGSSSLPKHSTRRGVGGGLKESHLAALNWLASECNARLEGAEVGSLEVVFKPRPKTPTAGLLKRGHLQHSEETEVIELKNPGSVWLIWQAIFPYVVFTMLQRRKGGEAKEPAFKIRLKGGTNVPKSPSSEYMQQVFFPLCENIGLPRVEVNVIRRGWTTGAPEIGEVEISVFHPEEDKDLESKPSTTSDTNATQVEPLSTDTFRLQPFSLPQPNPFTLTSISITTLTGSQQVHDFLHHRLHTLLRRIPAFSSPDLPITTHPSSTASSGDERRLYVLLTAHTLCGTILGRDYLSPGRKTVDDADRRRAVELAARDVVSEFKREVTRGYSVDEFAEDQIVVFQALAEAASQVHGGRNGTVVRRGVEDPDEVKKYCGYRADVKGETGTLHTRTVRWVCEEMLGTAFDGVGGCEGGGLKRDERGVDDIGRGLAALDIDQAEEEE